jgi:hypothetical protein
MNNSKFAGFAISRREVAICVIQNNFLEHVRGLQLSNSDSTALKSLTEFVRRAIGEFGIDSASFEKDISNTRKAMLQSHMIQVLRSEAVALRPVTADELKAGFAFEPVSTRTALRSIVVGIWPALKDRKLGTVAIDAVASAVYGHIQRRIDSSLQIDDAK